MKPSSNNQVMTTVVNGYLHQKEYDSTYGTNYANNWTALNNQSKISDDLKFNLNETNWKAIAETLLAKDFVFGLCEITYEDGHKGSTLVYVNNVDATISSMEMTLRGTLIFRVNGEPAATDETSDSVMKMLTALSNASGGDSGLTPEQEQILAKFAINGSDNLLIEDTTEFGTDIEVDGKLKLNSVSDIETKDKSEFVKKYGYNDNAWMYFETNKFLIGNQNPNIDTNSNGIVTFVSSDRDSGGDAQIQFSSLNTALLPLSGRAGINEKSSPMITIESSLPDTIGTGFDVYTDYIDSDNSKKRAGINFGYDNDVKFLGGDAVTFKNSVVNVNGSIHANVIDAISFTNDANNQFIDLNEDSMTFISPNNFRFQSDTASDMMIISTAEIQFNKSTIFKNSITATDTYIFETDIDADSTNKEVQAISLNVPNLGVFFSFDCRLEKTVTSSASYNYVIFDFMYNIPESGINFGLEFASRITGDTITLKQCDLILERDPTVDLGAATKQYVDNKTAILMKHHITLQGTSTDSLPFCLCFDIECPHNAKEAQTYTKVSTVEQLKTLMNLYSFQGVCTGYYISFNVDVMSFGSQAFRYYQNTAMVEKDPSVILDGTNITIDDLMQTIPLVLL